MIALILVLGQMSANAQTLLLKPGGEDDRQASPVPEKVVAQRAAEFVQAIERGTPEAFRRFIDESTVSESSRASERWYDMLGQLRNQTGGIELISFRPESPHGVELFVKNRLTEWQERMVLMLEPEPPHRFTYHLIISSPEPPADVPEGVLTDERLSEEAEELFASLCKADAFSGAVLLAREDHVLFSGACGEADKNHGVPNRLDTRFSLASMNKMFTAVAVAQLVEAGKLSFEDPLSRFVPDLLAPGVAEKVRIKHLLTHSSGLGDYFREEFWSAPRSHFRTIDDFLEVVRGDTLGFEPGTRTAYSNAGYLLLGRVIERVSGQDYHEYVREHIYRPAGMDSTGEYELDRVNPDLAIGYVPEFTVEGVHFRNNRFEQVVRGGPAGGGYSTVGDLYRFARAFMGGELVSPAMVKTLMAARPELASPTRGFGFQLMNDRFIVGHSGGFPGVSTRLDMFPSTGHVLVVLSNYSNEGPFRILGLRKLVLR